MKGIRFIILAAPLLLLPAFLEAQQSVGGGGTDRDALYAREEFWVGVQAYNRYTYNEAILSFERALSYRPGDPLYLDWLGRAYYRSGLEDTALRQWQAAAGIYGEGTPETLLLANRIETVRNRRSLFPHIEGVRYVESGRYPGRYDNIVAFRQPSAILALEDGSAWVVAYGSNEILQIDVNGLIRRRRRGPVNGFDRPYDIARGQDGRLYVSEYRGSRISVLNAEGDWQYYIGSKGIEAGKLIGPQNITIDEEGYLYVVEYGNRRISKFDPDGTFILSFGQRETGFRGLLSPTGIAAGEGRVFVADGVSRQIYVFDRNGRYLGVLASEGLQGPESLRFFPDGRLLTADTNRLLLIDIDSAIVSEIGFVGNAPARITGAAADSNGNILAASFNADEVLVMTPIDDIAAGLFVQIERVVADNFPLVTVELQVQDRNRQPIVGLDARNFLLSENGQSAAEQNFLYAGYSASDMDIAVLMERSPASSRMQEDLAAAVRDINASASRIRSLISAGEQPFRERLGNEASGGISADALAQAGRGSAAAYTPRWRFDLGLRLAATDLLPGAKKRAVVFVTTGRLGELAFEQYSLSELAAYLANNGIVFLTVLVGGNSVDADIRYLCNQTGGRVLSLYRPEGIGPALEQLTHTPSGSYILNYRSRLSADYGRAYLPVEAEVYLLERSGRDRTGYFPPESGAAGGAGR
ncbi:MAG: NHL repeat-containing protein [Treponema sp.]|jgi:DNA-binding beta-propeller fold protein YncE|nr:NHL repeat-containing protein [Treponema sp.]